ncbi:MAG: twin-arginine translocase subunit TatB [Pseudomonadales bacterium]|nr:twin-arginine translocase subunit TatB [Pseudomonadales bacterium]
MFDIGFPELLLVCIVSLLVIGPEKLPETVRTVALWVGRIRRGLANIKQEIENEIGADEIRQQLHNESVMKQLRETRRDLQDMVDDTGGTIREIKQSATLDAPLTEAPRIEENKDDGAKQSESAG